MAYSIDWLKQNAFFMCGLCDDANHEPNCYPVAELRIYRGEPCCENCFDYSDKEDGDQEHWGELPAFDPFAAMEKMK